MIAVMLRYSAMSFFRCAAILIRHARFADATMPRLLRQRHDAIIAARWLTRRNRH